MNPIVWQPQAPETSQMWAFMRHVEQTYLLTLNDYQALHAWSIQSPASFWSSLCDFFQIQFDTPPITPLKPYHHMIEARWFEGATFNFAKCLLSRHDDHLALVCINEQGHRDVFSYAQLEQAVAQCAAGLTQAGVVTGTRVSAILPNTFYAVIAMLATASIGAIWSSCSPDFGLEAMVERFGQIQPEVLFVCDGYQYQGKSFDTLCKIQEIQTLIPELTTVVVCPCLNTNPDVLDSFKRWDDFIVKNAKLEFTALPFNHPLYILFSSGTTGSPKCIVHGAGGTLLQHMKELALHTDIRAKDNLCFYTTCGWMMWNWMVSVLSLGATLTLYDGAPMHPTPTRLFDIIQSEGVSVFGTSAKFLSSVEKTGLVSMDDFKLPTLRCILSTGSPLLPQNYDFVYQHIKSGLQLSSISGGTDIVSCFALGNPLLPVHRGELQCLGLGMNVAVWDENGVVLIEQPGELVCTTPFPSMPLYFWNDPHQERYRQSYFEKYPGVWAQGDRAQLTCHQGLIIYGRSDAVLNPGGVRIGTAEIYHQVEKLDVILDSVVVAQTWGEDVRVVLFVKLRPDLTLDAELQKTIRDSIRTHTSPRHVPSKILQVSDIPRTINGKIVELAVRDVIEGRPIRNLGSIANPEAFRDFMNRPELEKS